MAFQTNYANLLVHLLGQLPPEKPVHTDIDKASNVRVMVIPHPCSVTRGRDQCSNCDIVNSINSVYLENLELVKNTGLPTITISAESF